MTARVGLEIARWVFAFLGWTLLLVSLWERGLVRTLLPSLLKGLGTILGGAGALAIVIAVVQAFFLEKIKGWVEQQRLEITHGQKIVEEMVTAVADCIIGVLQRVLETGGKFDGCSLWEDMCYNKGPLLGPAQFQRYLVP